MYFGVAYIFCVLCPNFPVKGFVSINTNMSDYYTAAHTCLRMNGTIATIDAVQYHWMCLMKEYLFNESSRSTQFWIMRNIDSSCNESDSHEDTRLNPSVDMCTYVDIDRDGQIMCQDIGCSETMLPSLCDTDGDNKTHCYTTSSKHDITRQVFRKDVSSIQASMLNTIKSTKASKVNDQTAKVNTNMIIGITICCLLTSVVFIVLATAKFCYRKLQKRKGTMNSMQIPYGNMKDVNYLTPGSYVYSTFDESELVDIQYSCTQNIMSEKGRYLLSSGVYDVKSFEESNNDKDSDTYELAVSVPNSVSENNAKSLCRGPRESHTEDTYQIIKQSHLATGNEIRDCTNAGEKEAKNTLGHSVTSINISSRESGDKRNTERSAGAYFTLEKKLDTQRTNCAFTAESKHNFDDENPYLEPKSIFENIESKGGSAKYIEEDMGYEGIKNEWVEKKNSDSKTLQKSVLLATTNTHEEEIVYHVIQDVSSNIKTSRKDMMEPSSKSCTEDEILGLEISECGNIYHSIVDHTDPDCEQEACKFLQRVVSETDMLIQKRKAGEYDILRRSNRNLYEEFNTDYSTCEIVLK